MEFDGFRLAASTADLGMEPAARSHADLVEFRLDLASSPLSELDAYGGELPLLCTNRPTWEGGECDEDEATRLATLETAAEHPAVEAVDVELASIEDGAQSTIDHAHEHGASVVASVHDFDETPPGDDLARLAARATAAGDVGKVAVTAADRGDVLRLLSVTDAVSGAEGAVATMAMGEAGRHSRAVAPLYGSRIGYAPVDAENATAPGQYDLETLDGLVRALGGR